MIQSLVTSATLPDGTAAAPVALGLGDYYRALYEQVRQSLEDYTRPAAIGVTSCTVGEGVTTVCQNLAVAASQQLRKPVLLIDASEPTSRQQVEHGVMGLYDVLLERANPSDCIRAGTSRNLFVLGPGRHPDECGLPFPREALADLLTYLKREFAFVVFDLPVCTELTDCFSICGLLDGVLLVVEAERVRRQVVAHARDHLFQVGARLLGIVLNKRRNHVPDWIYRRL